MILTLTVDEIISPLTRGYMAPFSLITTFVSSDLLVSFYFNCMSALDSSLVLGYVAFFGMGLNKRATGVMIMSHTVF